MWIALFALDEPDHLRDRIFRWDQDQHVHVIRHQVPFQDFRLLLHRQTVKDFAQVPAEFGVQRLPPALRYEDDVIFAVPGRVA